MRKYLQVMAFVTAVFVTCLPLSSNAGGAEPTWERGAIRFGTERQKIQNTHLLNRPYRPFHVYGNTVRRLHYRGRILPELGEFNSLATR